MDLGWGLGPGPEYGGCVGVGVGFCASMSVGVMNWDGEEEFEPLMDAYPPRALSWDGESTMCPLASRMAEDHTNIRSEPCPVCNPMNRWMSRPERG